MAKRLLILEDGTIFEGKAFGADLDVTGEIVFNTGMTGYQESFTDQLFINGTKSDTSFQKTSSSTLRQPITIPFSMISSK